ncbi:prolyl-tRna synthetase (ProRS) [Cardiosporidium cionae]|uniref:proline--tRNA ligase n=1 Tax=Cardiosporidium cionae TaxID=476202 RepID=A0ABQ7JG08_9APIC|nr:prolyl-tRna synthetase (ProRS) [Cardiosporidium cionae]|eukprot:KAF8822927.1 prolyl-tRna synthetase (ProRS) [Cardiosporidium cionae]
MSFLSSLASASTVHRISRLNLRFSTCYPTRFAILTTVLPPLATLSQSLYSLVTACTPSSGIHRGVELFSSNPLNAPLQTKLFSTSRSLSCGPRYGRSVYKSSDLLSLNMEDEIPFDDLEKSRKIQLFLGNLGISFKEHFHPKAMTVNDLLSTQVKTAASIVKNLFLKDKANKFYLVTSLIDIPVNLRLLEKKLKAKSLRFADNEALLSLLNVRPGAVSPLALSEDSHADLLKFVKEVKHSPIFISIAGNETEKRMPNEDNPVEDSKVTQPFGPNVIGINCSKEENFAEWYTQVIQKGEMIEYYDISGCYIIRPWAFFIWEIVQRFFDDEIKKLGVENACFPMFVTKAKLEAEKQHVDGFSPEVAWVTRYGESDLSEPVAIRPTSETIMYPAFAKWIRSHRDLPLKLNQVKRKNPACLGLLWNTVVRWEFKQPTPFLRSREFLWQEGHTAHTTKEEAYSFAKAILELYRQWYEDYLAVPVIKGIKSENEKFAGGDITTTVEGYIQESGRGIQAATSHLLGSNFANIFGIDYEDENAEKKLCHQTSWGCTTRSIGIMAMIHGDDNGLIIPPRVVAIQVVIVPITYKEDNISEIMGKCFELKKLLEKSGIRVKLDDRVNYTPGWKYNHWEQKGVPIRLEIGPRDLKHGTTRLVRRDNGEKMSVSWDTLVGEVSAMLRSIHNFLFEKAKKKMDDGIVQVTNFNDVTPAICNKKLVLVPWCEEPETEDQIKKETARLSLGLQAQHDATSALTSGIKCLCIPFDQPELPKGTKCFWTGKPAKRWSLWGRSY